MHPKKKTKKAKATTKATKTKRPPRRWYLVWRPGDALADAWTTMREAKRHARGCDRVIGPMMLIETVRER